MINGVAGCEQRVFGSTGTCWRADVCTVHPDNFVLLHRAPKLRPEFMTAFRTLLQPSPHPQGSHICETGSLSKLFIIVLTDFSSGSEETKAASLSPGRLSTRWNCSTR